MKKYLLALAILSASSAAYAQSYDLSAVNVEQKTAIDSTDLDSTFYVPVYDTTGRTSEILPTTELRKAPDILFVSGTNTLDCDTNGTGVINYISSGSASATLTLPAATGTGCEYQFVWSAAPYSSGDVIQVTGNDSFNGMFVMAQDGGSGIVAFETSADTDQLTFTSSTKGAAQAGAGFRVIDAATDKWIILDSNLIGTGTEATPGATGQRS